MGWYKAHSSLNREQGSIDLIDRCINCGSEKRIRSTITMEFGEGNFEHGPICYDCYNSYQSEKLQVINF